MSDFDEKDLLTRELRDRSTDVGGHPIGLDAVKQSARTMQRRRNMVTGAVAAVVASVALPTGVAVISSLTADGPVDEPGIAGGPTKEPTTPAPTPRPDGTFPLTVDGLPRGTEPQLPYIDQRAPSVVTPGGSLRTPVAYGQVTRYDDGWLGVSFDAGGSRTDMLDADMNVERSFPSGESFTQSNDGSQVAYVEIQDDGSQHLVNAPTDGGDVQAWTFPEQPAVRPIGFVDRGTVLYQTEGEDPAIGLVSAEGKTELRGFTSVSDADVVNGLVVGQTKSDQLNGSCYGVMEPAVSTSTMVWETCDHSLDGFSPDGRYVIGSVPDFDVAAPTLAILDARTADVIVEFEPDKGDHTALLQRAWEDEDTLLGIALKDTTMTFLRFELDGRVEEAADPVEVQDPFADPTFRFGVRAW